MSQKKKSLRNYCLLTLALIVAFVLIAQIDFPEVGYSNINFVVNHDNMDDRIEWSEDTLWAVVIITEDDHCVIKNPSPQKNYLLIECLEPARPQLQVRYEAKLDPGRYVVHTFTLNNTQHIESRHLTIDHRS